MNAVGFPYMATATQVTKSKRGCEDAFGLSAYNDENLPAPKFMRHEHSPVKAVTPQDSTSPSPLVIDLTSDDEPAIPTATTQKRLALSSSFREVIDLSEEDSSASSNTDQSIPAPRHDGKAAKLRVLSPEGRLTISRSELEFGYNSNGYPLQQAKMVSRRTTKQERAVNRKLTSFVKELEFPSWPNLGRDLLRTAIANTSVSITGQKGVQDTVEALVQSLRNDELESIRYVDCELHRLFDFKPVSYTHLTLPTKRIV